VAVNLSIKSVPDQLAASLRVRATRNHRSIQGELMAILEEALESDRRLDARKLLGRVRKLKLATDAQATRIVRDDRDGH
jgi:plasmid stability protein